MSKINLFNNAGRRVPKKPRINNVDFVFGADNQLRVVEQGSTTIIGSGSSGSGGTGENIYTEDGTLSSNRTLTQNGKSLEIVQSNFKFISSPNENLIGLNYIDADSETTSVIIYNTGNSTSSFATFSLDVATGDEGTVNATPTMAAIGFLDFSVDPDRKILVEATVNGVNIDGNGSGNTVNTEWHNWNGSDSNQIAALYNNGNMKYNMYPNTRDDSGTFTPTSFLYPDGGGNLLSAPLDYAKPYKVYTALLTQTGTSAPTAIVLENTLSGSVSWAYSSVGLYVGVSDVDFDSNKTWVIVGKTSDGLINGFAAQGRAESGIVIVDTGDIISQAVANDQLANTPIEIRVYP